MNPDPETGAEVITKAWGKMLEGAKKTAEGILEMRGKIPDSQIQAGLTKVGMSPEALQWAKDYADGKLSIEEFMTRQLETMLPERN
jgi:hypothetical protein